MTSTRMKIDTQEKLIWAVYQLIADLRALHDPAKCRAALEVTEELLDWYERWKATHAQD